MPGPVFRPGAGADGDLDKFGDDAANGGDDGAVGVTISGYFQGRTTGVHVQSAGGQGGGGENGGNAGAVTAQVEGTVRTAVVSRAPGVLAKSLGSVGGNGGHAAFAPQAAMAATTAPPTP